VLSDHADWEGLHEAIAGTSAQQVIATHGFADVMARRLAEMGLRSSVFQTRYEGEEPAGDEESGIAAEGELPGLRSGSGESNR
jgi:putative mRNA 3-end processing factor